MAGQLISLSSSTREYLNIKEYVREPSFNFCTRLDDNILPRYVPNFILPL